MQSHALQAEAFDVIAEHLRDIEGGLVDHPNDPGRRTNFGITQATLNAARLGFPALKLPETVDSLTWPQAKEVYRLQFWQVIRGDELPATLALATLDAAVNSSPRRAVRWLQLALGVTADGWIGAQTLAAARRCDVKAVLSEFSARRAHHYMLQDEIDDDFGLGWARRLFRVYNLAIREFPP